MNQISPFPMLLPFAPGCVRGTLLRRVKRFSVECLVEGERVWAHTNNSGSMLGLVRPGTEVWLSPAPAPGRKLPFTLEMVGLPAPQGLLWVGVNTLTPNRLLRRAFEAGLLPWAAGYSVFTPEAKRGSSRLDALLTGKDLPPLWVECKNVTLVEEDVAAFPDAVTERGHKHMREMMDIRRSGERAAFFYCIQRADARCFGPADYVDSTYAALFYEGLAQGVEAYPHEIILSLSGIGFGSLLPLAPCP